MQVVQYSMFETFVISIKDVPFVLPLPIPTLNPKRSPPPTTAPAGGNDEAKLTKKKTIQEQ